MSNPRATHRFVAAKVHEPTAGPSAPPINLVEMYRMSDGMRVAIAKEDLVQFGEDPAHPQMRFFLSHDYAMSFLRKLADRDWAVENGVNPADPDFKQKSSEYGAVIEEVDKKALVQVVSRMPSLR